MQKFRFKITRYFTSAEEAVVEVEAPSEEAAHEIVEARYMEGEYEGTPDVEWEEDADAWDATDHEIEIVKED